MRWETTIARVGSVDGTILVSSVLAALNLKLDREWQLMAGVAVTVLVFAAAHGWSAALAAGAERRRLPTSIDLLRAARHEQPMLEAMMPALIVLTVGAAGLFATDTSVLIALLVNVVVLFAWGYGLARLDGAGLLVALGLGFVTCALGVVLVVLKLLVK